MLLSRSPSAVELRQAAHTSAVRSPRSRSLPAPARAAGPGCRQRLPPASALPAWLSRFSSTASAAETPVAAPAPASAAPVPIALAQTDEAAGALKRTQESAAAGVAPVSLQRPPRGGDPLPPGPGWAWVRSRCAGRDCICSNSLITC